jgi:glycosyl transferase family 25
MKIFVINLDRSPDRLDHMKRQLGEAELSSTFCRVAGADGIKLPLDLLAQFLDAQGRIKSKMSAGEVGCYASHMLCWMELLKTDHPYAIVLEDDVVLEPNFAADVIAKAGDAWDIIHLSGDTKSAVLSTADLESGHHLVRYFRVPIHTAAYVIRRRCADKLLVPRLREHPVDIDLFRCANSYGINVLGIYPAIARQLRAGFDSLISPAQHGKAVRLCGSRISTRQRFWGYAFHVRQLGTVNWLRLCVRNVRHRIARLIAPEFDDAARQCYRRIVPVLKLRS